MERLKALAQAAKPPMSSLENRILAETALPVVYDPSVDPLQAATEGQLMPLLHAADFAGLTAAFDRLFARKTFCGSGYRTYRVAQSLMLSQIDTAAPARDAATAETLYAPYRQWWLQDRTDPAAAAVYAQALLATDLSGSVNEKDSDGTNAGMEHLRGLCGEARRVLAHAGPKGRRNWLWRHADFTLTFVAWSCGVEDEALLAPTFAAVQTLDPHEFGIYDDRAAQLLPCSAGSVAAIDRFACAAAKRTTAQFGDLLYARVYDTVLGFEDPESTRVDPDRLLAGFADWFERFPSQALANRYAAHAHAFGDDATLRRLFRDAVREIQPTHWFDHDQPLEAWRRVTTRRRRAN